MSETALPRLGVYAIAHESEAPVTDDYTTLVMIHGFAWCGGTFQRMIPFAKENNSRVVLINRRDYPELVSVADLGTEDNHPESEPLSPDDIAKMYSAEGVAEFMKERASDVYGLLVELIKSGRVAEKGGIALCAWSFGTQFANALLAHASSLSREEEVDVVSKMRHVGNLDMPSLFLGYPPKDGCWNPLLDMTIDPDERVKIFMRWITGYFLHGETVDELVPRDFTLDIPPTLDTMSPDDIASAMYVNPGFPGASDDVLFRAVMDFGICDKLRRQAYLNLDENDPWAHVKVRHVFGDRSAWSEFWGAECLRKEIEDERKAGRRPRQVEIVRLRGANHFGGWDQPKRTLRALLGKNPDMDD
ncbi:hypothetical protein EIP91_007799 [Steccherinum ochraceum]|uniref:AB hydrolase-1 domain-containing protein n=1 Tax=Steccherinum ochraceum TaxID=92696 RepID=A0A4R0R9H9_9APHY|nr:hypothetical protein EIP91_007799 [Steccherinum ochraceum]